ncbi:MarR family transcriptional regulator [Streptomyces sp. V4-01]|uniref:MarR family transcriptional regulator n=1 Tax=Actinacidiphila polyblastidii TaxID=3110430 RepID=A0ABU7PHT8_9ACTN|nr:MarR family transcriptional regulator [Streptomyces sp. V4-01]
MEETPSIPSAEAVRAAQDIRVVFSRLRRRLREEYRIEDLTPSQTSVLSRLDREGPASTSALAAAERVRPQSMAATVAVLEERGLIGRRADPDDGRKQLVSVNAHGREFLADRRRAGEEWMARALRDHFTEQELRTVLDALPLLERLARV